MLWLYVHILQFNLVYFIWNNLLPCDILEVKVESHFVTKQQLLVLLCDILEVKKKINLCYQTVTSL